MGVDSNGVGFGNLSVRDGVAGTFTSRFSDGWSARIDAGLVQSWRRFRKELAPLRRHCDSFIGIVDACAIYESDPSTSAVIHCHDSDCGRRFSIAPTTSKSVAYGTPEMAYEIMRLFKVSDVRSRKIFVMAGHEAGIVTFGENLEDAFDVLMRERRESWPCI